MIKIIILSFLFPLMVEAGNIGLCGGKLFLERQKLIDSLVLQLKNAGQSEKQEYRERIIKEYGYIGIENLIRYREDALKDVFISLLQHEDFYVRYKSIYALRFYGNVDKRILMPFLSSTNQFLKEMAVSTLTEISNTRNKVPRTFPDFNYGINSDRLKEAEYFRDTKKIEGYEERFTRLFLPSADLPIADSFTAPVIRYDEDFIFKGPRISFGAGESIKHTGDDCGWFREGSSVFAIGKGIVRLVHHSPDWGFLMVIEHRMKDGGYISSIYGHLSQEIYIVPGDIVKKGEKIGTIGLSYSVENGGYGAHLHFGISKGPWLKSKHNYAQNISVMHDNKKQMVKEYRFTEKGVEMVLESGMIITAGEEKNTEDLNRYLFWLKGYEFSKDIDRIWLDPREFLKKNQ
ncbi:MAG: peptidoglycan DD-metalloendopeptidase family protein [Spirochaetes bacterium]|nr:peptidoglycan DD-metalloendopeptidase family protein [Spirochaetota bacterium]